MKIKQERTPEEFQKIDIVEFHRLWYIKALTDKQIAILYGVTKEEVKEKRKEFKLNALNCAVMYLAGGDKYKGKDIKKK